MLHNGLLHNGLLHNDLLHNDLMHNDLLHNGLLHDDLLHNDLLHNELLHNDFYCVLVGQWWLMAKFQVPQLWARWTTETKDALRGIAKMYLCINYGKCSQWQKIGN